MAAARFSSEVLEMFCLPIPQEVNRRQKRPIAPARVARETYINFELNRNNFNGWFSSWKMKRFRRLSIQRRSLAIRPKTKTRFTNLIENEIASLGRVKTQFGLVVKFSIVRDEDVRYIEHYFAQTGNAVFNRNSEA